MSLDNASNHIVGVDEAGRGALIGNVVAAAVILPLEYNKVLTVDSKSLSERKREQSAHYIQSVAIDFAIGIASPKEIDALNIHHATLLAMQRAIESLTSPIAEVWVDGKFTPTCEHPAIAFVKGDSLHDCISAASILAKTYRDTELRELSDRYPQYGFAQHKGYPTKAHQAAIANYGILPEHRRSYKTVKAYL